MSSSFLRLLALSCAWPCLFAEKPAAFRYANEFAVDSAAIVEPRQAVVFSSDSKTQSARYQLSAGEHRFCLEGARNYFDGLSVENHGVPVRTWMDPQGCARVQVEEGTYTVRIDSEARRSVFGSAAVLTADLPSPPLHTAQGLPRKGYWAMGVIYTFMGQSQSFGRIRAHPPLMNEIDNFPQAMAIGMDDAMQIDEYALFQFAGSPAVLGGPAGNFFDYQSNPFPFVYAGTLVMSAQRCDQGYPACNNFASNPMVITDLRSGSQFRLSLQSTSDPRAPIYFGGTATKFNDNTVNVLDRCLGFCGDFKYFLLFRFFPDGTQMGPLLQGEVALYQQANFLGKTAVFPGNHPNFGALTSSATTIDKSAVSVKLGPNTAALLYPSANYGGTAQLIQADTLQLPSPASASSIQIVSLTSIMLANKACDNCNFQGIDLSGLDLSGFSLNGARFADATLTNTRFSGAQLAGADFTGAKLSCADFSGTDSDHLNDLSATIFTNVQITPPGACRTNLSYTTLTAQSIPPALWKSVNFTGAVFTDLPGKILSSQAQPLDLTGAILTNASLKGAVLDYATGLPAAAVTGVRLDGASLKGCNLSNAVFDNANLTKADLTGAVLSGASFDHSILDYAVAIGKVDLSTLKLNYTSLQHVDFTGAVLTGKNLQTLILDYATGLANTDLTETVFSNGSLRHVDLRTAQLYGAKFINANLDGANLSGAFLLKKGNTLTANLEGAFLRNVNLSQGQISGADFSGASFFSTAAVGTGGCAIDATTGFTNNCASAAGAVMDSTDFGSAYLFGVDFSGATAQGVSFGGSFLAGANFSKASLSQSGSGNNTGFAGAFLQGTNFAEAKLLNGISLDNAVVDFTAVGNTLSLVLSNAHTVFAGYWGASGSSVCALMTYNNATVPPVTDSTTACPNGNSYADGCGLPAVDGSNLRWKSRLNLDQTASYASDSTYTTKPASGQQVCAYDFKWIPINIP